MCICIYGIIYPIMAKTFLKEKARNRRADGESIKVIAEELGVSSSTVSLWCRDIELTKEQIERLERNSRDPFYGRRLDYAKKQQRLRRVQDDETKTEAQKLLGKITDRDKFIGGILLYWAEGFKKDNMVGFSNMDSKMISVILDWLINSLKIEKRRIKLRVVINGSHRYRIDEIHEYWSKVTKIPIYEFYKPTFHFL